MLALRENDVFADRYLLVDLVGTRGISEVWACEDLLENSAVVALKIYTPLDKTDEQFLQRLRQEVASSQPVRHPNLLHIEKFDIYHETPYLVMPYMNNGSLRRKLIEQGPLAEFEVAVLLKQIGGALNQLHTADPVQLHQNIKPDNILLTEDEHYMLANFKVHNQIRSLLPRLQGHSEGATTAYAPPELFSVRPDAYPSSDIFALGVTLYEACTGKLPWMGNGGLSLMQGAAIPYLPTHYSKELNNIVTACLDPKWENRPTAQELVTEGNYYVDNYRWKPYGRFSASKVDVVKYEKRSPLKVIKWAAAILVILAVLGALVYTQTDLLQDPSGKDKETVHVAKEKLEVDETSENEGSELAATTTDDERETALPPAAPAPRQEPELPKEEVVTPVNESEADEAPRTEPVTPPVRKTEPKRTAFAPPSTAEDYLKQLQNKNIPLNVREQWRQDVWRFFDRRAAVNYVVGDQLVGILSADELVDMMLDKEKVNSIRVDSTKKNASGKIDQVFVHVQESTQEE